jgi:hypothetical protein
MRNVWNKPIENWPTNDLMQWKLAEVEEDEQHTAFELQKIRRNTTGHRGLIL